MISDLYDAPWPKPRIVDESEAEAEILGLLGAM